MTEGEHSMEDRARIFAPVLAQVKRLADEGKPVAIAIDGRCGSGKTWLSGLIGDRFPCNILHMDDFYLPFGRRAQGWEAVPGGNMDFRRLQSELLVPIRAGEAAVYRAYLCPEDRFGEALNEPQSDGGGGELFQASVRGRSIRPDHIPYLLQGGAAQTPCAEGGQPLCRVRGAVDPHGGELLPLL